MTESMRAAIKGEGGGLQSISTAVSETIGNAIDTRSSGQKKADQASVDLHALGKNAGPTVEGSTVSGKEQVDNQMTGKADHLDMQYRKKV